MDVQRRRVLVVEDDADIRSIVAEMLGDDGYDVEVAAHGGEALAILDRWQPHLIILDLMMPEMDGWQFREAQRARALALDVPVVVLSAVHELPSRTRTLGAAALFSKPFDLDALMAEIDRLLTP